MDSMSASLCVNDHTLGPTVRGCRGDFDFTLKFEHVVLSIVPSSVFIALALPRVVYLVFQASRVVGAASFQYLKLSAVTVFAGLQLALLVLATSQLRALSNAAVPSAALGLVSALAMLALSGLEHTRCAKPSSLLNAYLLISLLLDAAQCRTLWLGASSPSTAPYARLFTASLAVKAVVLLLESVQKGKWLLPRAGDEHDHSPEEVSNIYSLGVYYWLNDLFLRGYRKVLRIDDLYPLDEALAAPRMEERFMAKLDVGRMSGRRFGLLLVLFRTFPLQWLKPVPARVALVGFKFCQPLFINALLRFLQAPDAAAAARNTGYGLIGASVFIYVGVGLSSALYYYYHERSLFMARSCLVSAVYRKTTESKLAAADDSAALTLMSGDVERFQLGFGNLHELWAAAVEIGLASWLLYRELGAAFAAPIVVVLVCFGGTIVFSNFVGPLQKAWMEKIQKRVGLTSSVISNMKNLKISGITEPVATLIQGMRVDELLAGRRFRNVLLYAAVFAFIPLQLSPVFTFAVTEKTLDVTRIFTSLSYLVLLTEPLTTLLQFLPQIMAAVTCLARIQAFIEKEPRRDFRRVVPSSEPSSPRGGKSNAAVSITNGNFGWTAEETVLKDINISIPTSSFTIIVGPVASGKSTLCKALLGELSSASGEVTIAADALVVGFCDQTPFLSNATIKENIVGYSAYDAKKYHDVVEATMLLSDFDVLPHGDRTSVGSNGITLSGGQRQRVSMARALYLDSTLVLFDDSFAGLDADTEDQVFRRIFGPDGLLRRRGATVILCTHSVKHLPAADHIVALGPDGRVVEQGSFDALVANESYVAGLGVRAGDGSSSSRNSRDNVDAAPEMMPPVERSATTRSVAPTLAPDDRARMVGDRAVYRYYLRTMTFLPVFGFTFTGLLTGVFLNLPTVWLKFWAEDAVSPTPSHSRAYYTGIYALLQVMFLASLYYMARICFITMIRQSGTVLHQRALDTVVHAPLTFFTTTDTGVTINLFAQDMTLIDGELPIALLNNVSNLFAAIGQAAVIATASPYIAISYPFLCAVLWAIQKFYLRTSRQLRFLDLEAKSPLYAHFIDTIKGLATIRALGWTASDISLNHRLLDTSQRPAYLLTMIQRWLFLTLQLVVAVLALVLVALATQLRSNSGFTGASLVTLMLFGDMLAGIVKFYTQLETSIGAVSRLKSFSETVKAEDLPGEDADPAESWPREGRVEVKGVSASYGSAEQQALQVLELDEKMGPASPKGMALQDLQLELRKGEKVAICGRSGSGKSSLVLLLLRLLDPLPSTPATSLTIDGIPLSSMPRSLLRRRVIAVPQDSVFLPDGSSFKANLDPFGLAADAECDAVLRDVAMADFVAEHGGLHAGMSPDTLSQGQRQLFSLARAVVRRRVRERTAPPEEGGEKARGGGLLILDEVSSSVDRETEAQMHAVIGAEFRDYTILMVSHRLEMVMDFDTVVVLDKGRKVEQGNPRELAHTEGSRFKELWDLSGVGDGEK